MQNYYRNLPPPKAPPPPPAPTPTHVPVSKPPLKPLLKPPPKKPPKKKLTFNSLKKDTCKSLCEVEYFLNNFSDFLKYVKLINLLKGKK